MCVAHTFVAEIMLQLTRFYRKQENIKFIDNLRECVAYLDSKASNSKFLTKQGCLGFSLCLLCKIPKGRWGVNLFICLFIFTNHDIQICLASLWLSAFCFAQTSRQVFGHGNTWDRGVPAVAVPANLARCIPKDTQITKMPGSHWQK